MTSLSVPKTSLKEHSCLDLYQQSCIIVELHGVQVGHKLQIQLTKQIYFHKFLKFEVPSLDMLSFVCVIADKFPKKTFTKQSCGMILNFKNS